PANGRQLLADTHDEDKPVITTDGAGGAIVAWQLAFTPPTDVDIYGARVDASGTVSWAHSLYAPGGVQDAPAIVSDGAGGAIVPFEDSNAGNFDIEAVRYDASGVTVWGTTFSPQVTVANPAGDQVSPVAAPDGAGGATIAWPDYRN